jgi:hypothetical protein
MRPAGRHSLILATGLALLIAPGQASSLDRSATAVSPSALKALAAKDTSALTIKDIMDSRVDPSGDFLFESVEDIADKRGITHKAPKTARQWAAVRHHLQVLMDAPALLIVPGRKAANPEDRSKNPAVENQPEQIQRLINAQHADFVVRAQRLHDAAAVGMKAAQAKDARALFVAISGIDKACESCHLHYWYPNDRRAHQAAKEEGGIIE